MPGVFGICWVSLRDSLGKRNCMKKEPSSAVASVWLQPCFDSSWARALAANPHCSDSSVEESLGLLLKQRQSLMNSSFVYVIAESGQANDLAPLLNYPFLCPRLFEQKKLISRE